MPRTIQRFAHEGDAWSMVSDWALNAGLKLTHEFEDLRVYKATNIFYPGVFEIAQQAGFLKIEAYIRVAYWVRLCYGLLIPSEMSIDPAGVPWWIRGSSLTSWQKPGERADIYRRNLNLLLNVLGQPQLEA